MSTKIHKTASDSNISQYNIAHIISKCDYFNALFTDMPKLQNKILQMIN